MSSRVKRALGGILDSIGDRLRPSSSDDAHAHSDSGGSPPPTERDRADASDLLDVDPELLDAKRRIVQLLVESGGSVPQADLVDRTRWTSSTISRKLGEMEADGVVTRHTVGVGKVVVLDDDIQ